MVPRTTPAADNAGCRLGQFTLSAGPRRAAERLFQQREQKWGWVNIDGDQNNKNHETCWFHASEWSNDDFNIFLGDEDEVHSQPFGCENGYLQIFVRLAGAVRGLAPGACQQQPASGRSAQEVWGRAFGGTQMGEWRWGSYGAWVSWGSKGIGLPKQKAA